MENYRGITVTPVFAKLFKYALLPKLTFYFEQSTLQFGFTKGNPMFLVALHISESRAESKFQTAKPLCIITVDSQKAFDVVSHVIMLDKLYETGLHPALWTVVIDFY
jgi:hypothetical protein